MRQHRCAARGILPDGAAIVTQNVSSGKTVKMNVEVTDVMGRNVKCVGVVCAVDRLALTASAGLWSWLDFRRISSSSGHQ